MSWAAFGVFWLIVAVAVLFLASVVFWIDWVSDAYDGDKRVGISVLVALTMMSIAVGILT